LGWPAGFQPALPWFGQRVGSKTLGWADMLNLSEDQR
jgi:hypothetical protein